MKKLFSLKLLIMCLCLMANTGCNNDDDAGNGGDSLPPATQTGANTVGCLVNGEVFLPRQEGINPAVVVNYEFIDGEFYFTLRFSNQNDQGLESVRLRTQKISLTVDNSYILNNNYYDNGDYIGGGGEYQTNSTNEYFTDSSNTGELNITRIDLSNSIISGTFWFDAMNEAGEIVEIREGRFDYEY